MRRLLWAVILLTLGTASASAQYYLNVFRHNGQQVQYVTEDIDSVTFTGNAIRDDGFHNGYEYVDLGLSVKWATCNVGAANPEDFGDYYSWGEIEKKSIYNWSSYKFRLSGDSYDNVKFIKYNTDVNRGTVDNKITIDLEDDVANVKWGGDWRIPTEAEINELKKRCTWTWTTLNGVKGYRVTSKVSGYTDRSIFLPAAGFRDGMSTKKNGTYGQYWSSSLYTYDTFLARHLIFGSSDVHENDYYRYNGQSVRPVCSSDGWLSHLTVSMNPDFIILIKGNSALLSVDVKYDEDDFSYSNFLSWRWNSDNPAVVTVNEDGAIVAVSNGIANITATSETLSVQCTVKVVNESNNNHKYVDLGLSVNWATCNVGASKPEDYGNYYAWGEVDIKDSYHFENYSFRASGDSYNNAKFSKYNTDGSRGTVDTKLSLDPEDDVAHIKWGGSWRMPTNAELEELITNCTWTWTTLNGVKGYRVTSKIPGYSDNSIFLPVAGCYSGSDIDYAGTYGCYWSSSLFTVDPYSACYLIFGLSNITQTNDNTRHYGQSVRPVCAKTTQDDSNPNSGITSLTLDNTNLTLIVGEEYSFQVTAWNGNEVVNAATVTWRSNNESVATVSTDGLVKAISVGIATITASCGDISATCSIIVNESDNGSSNGHEYVDLGLSVMWATFNVGATKPEEYGDYYAWGEVSPKTSYSWANYKWSSDGTSTSMTKYCLNSSYGQVDNISQLEMQDDAANVNWGNGWRLPTFSEWIELRQNCTLSWTTINGVKGYKLTSLIQGFTDKYIFLPAGGCYENTTQYDEDAGSYWSGTMGDNNIPYNADFDFGGFYLDNYSPHRRQRGLNIRPVYSLSANPQNNNVTSVSLNKTSLSLIIGVWDSLKVIALNGNEVVESAAFLWLSDNESVATVDSTGLVRAISVGSATIKAICGDKYATCFVTVLDHNDVTHEYVDLGLSVKWATCNVGAMNPQDHGGYYAWGETESKIEYQWENYKWCDGWWTKLTKYNYVSAWGPVDNLKRIEPEDDVVQANWGVNWRMPTSEELKELVDNCTWTWTTVDGKRGYRVTSNKTGYTDRSIFLPAAGGYINYSFDWFGLRGYYVSNTIGNCFNPGWPDCLVFDSEKESVTNSDVGRNYGFSVRPVYIGVPSFTSVTLDTTSLSLKVGEEYSLQATAWNGNEIVNVSRIFWKSDNESVATVSTSGLVNALSVGNATITAYCANLSATCLITVSKRDIGGDGTDNGHDYVDLGLSVGWATCNVGASQPEDYGGNYAWGETETKSSYTYANYRFIYSGSGYSDFKVSKYCTNDSKGVVDNKTTLDSDDDVAYVKWGANWRMPTKAEFEELIYNCSWNWTTINSVDGYLVTSNLDGYTDKSIFIPAAGYFKKENMLNDGCGYYRSASLHTSDSRHSSYLKIGSNNLSIDYYDYNRYVGLSVRPVYSPKTTTPNDPITITSISLDTTSLSLKVGEEYSLKVTAWNGNVEVDTATITWRSDNESVATVSSDGLVKAISVGNAVITASCYGNAATCSVTVDNEIIGNNGFHNGYEFVDLGLSVKWATYNVGASKPEEFGGHYAWGETSTKTDYTWVNYKFRESGDSHNNIKFSKYNTDYIKGAIDNKTNLDPEDDVAHVIWGGDWRMPNHEEQDELRNYCTWTWDTVNGVKGYRVTSNIAGYTDRSIFLPAAGSLSGTESIDYEMGLYWSNELKPGSSENSWNIRFENGDVSAQYYWRHYGRSVRPVCP